MDDLAGTLSAFLNSPEGKARLQNLAGMLAQNQEEAPAPSGDSGGLSSLLGALGGSSETSAMPDASALQLVTRLGPMLSAARQEDDRIRCLLYTSPSPRRPYPSAESPPPSFGRRAPEKAG